jgi:cytochrome c biogenesis protein CcmG/thiol:disulfide interchange protein DsbE
MSHPGEPQPRRAASPSRALLVLSALFFLLAAMIAAYSLGQRSTEQAAPGASPPAPDAPEVLRLAPAFSLPSLRGPERIGIGDFQGRVVVLNFFASWCAPCALEAADLERVWQEQRNRGVIFLGVAIQDQPAAAMAFLERHEITYPAVIDTSNEIMYGYRVSGIPTTFFIDAQGRITGRHAGIFVGDEGRARLGERIERARRGPR